MKNLIIKGRIDKLKSIAKQNKIFASRNGLIMSLEDSKDYKKEIESLKSEIKTLKGKLKKG